MRTLHLPCLSLLLAAGAAEAKTLHVDINSGACSDAVSRQQNTAAKPCCTIQQAVKLAQPGDTVLVGDGTYPDTDNNGTALQITCSGTAAAPIAIRAKNLHKAHIKGQLPGSSTSFTYCVQTFSGVQNVVLEGFELSGCADGISINNNNHHVVVRSNHIHDVGRRVTSTTSGQDAVSVGTTCSHVTIDRNIIHTIGRLPGSPYQNHDHGVYLRGSHVVITNNVFYDHQAGWAVHIYSPGNWKEYIDIVNNTFADANPARDGHILIYPMTRHLLIQNNISYQPRNAVIQNSSCTDLSDISVLNNLSDLTTLVSGTSCSFTISGNLMGKNPLFVNAAQRDYHLLAGSPAIDAGLLAGAPATDLDGNPRPAGSAVEIGAFEHAAAPVPDSAVPLDSGLQDGSPDGVVDANAADQTSHDQTSHDGPVNSSDQGSSDAGDDGCSCRTREGRPRDVLPLALLLLPLAGAWRRR